MPHRHAFVGDVERAVAELGEFYMDLVDKAIVDAEAMAGCANSSGVADLLALIGYFCSRIY